MVRRNDTTQGEDGERVSLPLIDEARPRRRPVVFALGAVVVSAWLHVFTPLARDVVRDVAVDAVNASIRGRIEVGRIDEIDFGRLGVSHVAVYDAEGRRVLQLEQARFEPDMASMLAGTIHFDSVQAEGGYVRLIETPEGPPSIATAFQAPETPDRAAESSGVVELDEIRVRRVRVTTTYEMARDLALADLHVTGELAFADGVFEAAVDSAGFTVERDGHVVGALESLSGSYDGADGGVAEGRARLRIGTADRRGGERRRGRSGGPPWARDRSGRARDRDLGVGHVRGDARHVRAARKRADGRRPRRRRRVDARRRPGRCACRDAGARREPRVGGCRRAARLWHGRGRGDRALPSGRHRGVRARG
jgi:hypothetical protein